MLKLTQKQKDFIENKIIEYFNGISDIQNEKIENSENAEELILNIRFKNFNKLKHSEELHFLIKNWNWDDGNEIAFKVLSHPMCDRATALMIYWVNTPDFFVNFENIDNVPNYLQSNYQLFRTTEKRLLNNEFELQNIKFNPKSIASWEAIENDKIPNGLKIESIGFDFIF